MLMMHANDAEDMLMPANDAENMLMPANDTLSSLLNTWLILLMTLNGTVQPTIFLDAFQPLISLFSFS